MLFLRLYCTPSRLLTCATRSAPVLFFPSPTLHAACDSAWSCTFLLSRARTHHASRIAHHASPRISRISRPAARPRPCVCLVAHGRPAATGRPQAALEMAEITQNANQHDCGAARPSSALAAACPSSAAALAPLLPSPPHLHSCSGPPSPAADSAVAWEARPPREAQTAL